MERERPEYLPPIQSRRWSFPWLLVIGVTVLVLAGYGVKQHLATQAAWEARFNRPKAVPAPDPAQPFVIQADDPVERIRRIRQEREAAEEYLKERASWRCIDGTPFRQIPGGWENVRGERC